MLTPVRRGDIGYPDAVPTALIHRRRVFRSLSVLALLAWLGFVTMGIARTLPMSAPPMTAASMHHAGAPTADGACGMAFGCHCDMLCSGAVVPVAPVLAEAGGSGGPGTLGAPPVPGDVGEPPLHPPSS